MAFNLSTRAQLLSQQKNVEVQIILEIDGVPLVFGAVEVSKLARIGEDGITIGSFTIGGTIVNPESRDFISLQGTSKNITSQLFQDKGGTGSISSVNIEMIDKNNELSAAFSPGANVDDVLSRDASLYMSFKNGAHPEDSIPIFHGIVDALSFPSGSAIVSISHPDKLKSREIYQLIQTKITSAITDSITIIPLELVTGIILSQNALTSYIRIEDEIIELDFFSGNNASNVTRGALGTTAVAHDIDTEVNTFYKLTGKPIEMALQLMLSNTETYYLENLPITRIGQDSDGTLITNSIFVGNELLDSDHGVTVGDTAWVTGAINPANNVNNAVIINIKDGVDGQYFIVAKTMTLELASTAVVKFKSQYNLLPEGMNMTPSQVDINGHTDLNTRFGSTFPTYNFSLKESIQAKEFLENEIYYPSGLYALPRKGRAGVGYTTTPLALEKLVTLNETNITNPQKLIIERSISKNFYNSIVWKFNEDILTDKFLAGEITIDADSNARIKTGNKPLKITSKGMVDDVATRTLITSQTRRFLDRYKYATQLIRNVKTLFKDSNALEVGDIVLFGSENMSLHDSKRGDRTFQSRLMEITNKKLNISTGEISLDLLDTAYEQDGKFGVVSPASIVGVGSTTTEIIITTSFGTTGFNIEKDKWDDYIGRNILIRSVDWTFQEITELKSFSPTNNLKMIVDAISAPPTSGYIVDIPTYNDADAAQRISHCFFDPQKLVVSGASNFIFDVADSSDFFVGSIIRIHDLTFAIDSIESVVTDITSNTITVETDLGFTPANGQFIELIGFIETTDVPYRLV